MENALWGACDQTDPLVWPGDSLGTPALWAALKGEHPEDTPRLAQSTHPHARWPVDGLHQKGPYLFWWSDATHTSLAWSVHGCPHPFLASWLAACIMHSVAWGCGMQMNYPQGLICLNFVFCFFCFSLLDSPQSFPPGKFPSVSQLCTRPPSFIYLTCWITILSLPSTLPALASLLQLPYHMGPIPSPLTALLSLWCLQWMCVLIPAKWTNTSSSAQTDSPFYLADTVFKIYCGH